MQTRYNYHIYSIKDQNWLESQRVAGQVLSKAIQEGLKAVVPGKTTREIDKVVETFILDHFMCEATFKGYKGFPAATCISVNNEIVHGIPGDRIIQEGDVVTLDSGVTHNGAIADMARTMIVGESKNIKHKWLLINCKLALNAAVSAINNTIERKVPIRLGTIGAAISHTAKQINAHVIVDLGGHGFESNTPHGYPFVHNTGEKDTGPILYPGTTIAIEPMITFGSPKIRIAEDGWTVLLEDVGVHEEDTIFIHEDRVEIIT